MAKHFLALNKKNTLILGVPDWNLNRFDTYR